MGNVTVVLDYVGRPASFGNKRVSIGRITFSSSYATGGDTIPAGDRKFGLNALERVFPMGVGFSVTDSQANPVAFDSETAPTKVLSFGDRAAAAIEPLTQADSADDLSNYSFTFMAVGG